MEQGQCDLDHLLKLSTDPSKLEGTLHVEPLESVKAISPDAFEAFLLGHEILASAIDHDALARLCEEIIEAPLQPHQMVVANGKQAVNGDCVTYTIKENIAEQIERVRARKQAIKEGNVEQDPAPDHPDDDTQDAVSHYDQMTFVVVHKGDEIATKSEKSDGFDGSDIFGKVIPAHEGKSNEGILDDSILVAADGVCTAAISGVLTAEPSKISISNELLVKNDVDFQTGRIIFPGSVVVNGSVRDRFSIKAEDDISIKGLVESADIESQRSITLLRGMAGKETGTIKAGKNLEAGYLEAVIAEVHGDASVKGEITNSQLTIHKRLNAENAAIRGGSIHASMGAQIGSVGSVQGVETELVIGSLPEIEQKIRAINELLPKIESETKSEMSKLDAYSAAIAKPTASQIEEQMGMQFAIDELKQRENMLNEARTKLHAILKKNTLPRLNIQKAIYAKVVVYLPGYRAEFPTELLGESTIELGPTGSPSITYRGQTVNLSDHARVITDDRILRIQEIESTSEIAA